jgi:uracil-DNA glycosylase
MPKKPSSPETLAELLVRIRACRACEGLPLGPRPIIQANPDARVAVIGHAPGRLVHASGIPWDDYSGERLRAWLGVTPEDFYNPSKIALVGMGFCYPGTGKSGDLPPRPECAPLWHAEVFSRLRKDIPRVLIGSYALNYYLGKRVKKTLTETVRAWKEFSPDFLVLPHPSGRNNGWLVKNPWFERDALSDVREVLRRSLAVRA